MSITCISAQEFARDPAQAERATTAGPVLVTESGRPTFALLKIEDYYKLAGKDSRSLLEVMDSLPSGDFDFDPPRMDGISMKPAELE